jgi:diguanylate cyclase (GGDEF)-like protein
MRGPGSTTAIAGGLLVAAAWAAGTAGLPAAYQPVVRVLPELLALLLLVLAWRFRRSRVAVAAAAVALTHLLLRGPLAASLGDRASAGLAVLALLLPINLGLLVWLRDRPVPRPWPLVHLAAIAVQPLLAGALLGAASLQGEAPPAVVWLGLLGSPHAALLAFLMAGVFTALAFAARRVSFEAALLWVLVAAALAVLGGGGPELRSLLLAAAQLVLLSGVIEDSYRLAYHDQLTGLPGRRALDEAMERLDRDYVIAMVDVDRFKAFNDRFGHDAGDQALRMVADELAQVGDGGRSFRYGGEEFALLFAGRTPAQAEAALEKLRAAIEARVFTIRSPERPREKPEAPATAPAGSERVTLTVSIGAAAPGPLHPRPDDVLHAADAALYRAKRRGRNRVVIEGLRGSSRGAATGRKRQGGAQRTMFGDDEAE